MKISPDELIHHAEDRKAARELAADQAAKGCGVCGGMFMLEALARQQGLGILVDNQAWDDDDEGDFRPF